MTENDCMNAERSDLYWAVVEHVKSWISQDGPLRCAIVTQGKLELRGTRVLDILLMLRGAELEEKSLAEKLRFECIEFLDLLPRQWREDVNEVAHRVVSAIDPAPLLSS